MAATSRVRAAEAEDAYGDFSIGVVPITAPVAAIQRRTHPRHLISRHEHSGLRQIADDQVADRIHVGSDVMVVAGIAGLKPTPTSKLAAPSQTGLPSAPLASTSQNRTRRRRSALSSDRLLKGQVLLSSLKQKRADGCLHVRAVKDGASPMSMLLRSVMASAGCCWPQRMP